MIKIGQTQLSFPKKMMFTSITWEAILWVVTGSIFRRLSKKLKRQFCKLLALGSPRLL